MPKFPSYQSQRSLTIEPTSPLHQGAAQEATAGAPVLEAAANITQKWNNALDTMQYTSAKASFESGMLDILNRAEQDTDYNGADKYFKELAELRRVTIKGFNNKMVEEKASFEFGSSSNEARLKIDNIFRKKQLSQSRAMLGHGIDTLIEKRVFAATPDEAMKAEQEIGTLLSMNQQAGVISPEEAQKMGTRTKTLITNKIERIQREAKVLENKRIKAVQEQIYDEGFDLMMTGQLTDDWIEAQEQIPDSQGGLRPASIRNFKRAIKRQKELQLGQIAEKNPKHDAFINLVDNVLTDRQTKQDIKDVLLNAYADGDVSEQEAKNLSLIEKQIKAMQGSNVKNPVVAGYRKLMSFFGKNYPSQEGIAEGLRKFIQALPENKDHNALVKSIIQDTLQSVIPDIDELPETGTEYMDENGNIRVILKGGEIEYVETE